LRDGAKPLSGRTRLIVAMKNKRETEELSLSLERYIHGWSSHSVGAWRTQARRRFT